VAAYGFKLTKGGESYETQPEGRQRDLIVALIAVVYTAFMIFAGGMKFIVLSAILYGPGTLLYIWARREQNAKVFKTGDIVIFAVAIVGALVGVYGLISGLIEI
jgi:arginine:ornithine antiporter/lysine permease